MAVWKSMILDHMKHDSIVVHAFVGEVLCHLKDSLPTLKNGLSWSDGVGSQYRSYKNFCNLWHHVKFSTCYWVNFFSTLHGKNTWDSIGRTVKPFVANASSHSLKEPFETPEKIFLWFKSNTKGVAFMCVSFRCWKQRIWI